MKKTFLLIALLFQLTFSNGQTKGEGKTDWSSWTKASPCFPNLYISFISYGWNEQVKKYQYNFKIKNTSSKELHFSLDIRFSSGEDYTADGRFDLSPGTEHTHTSMYYNTKPIPNSTNFFLSGITGYFENNGNDDWTVPTYSCDGSRQVCDGNCNKIKGSANALSSAGEDNGSISNLNKELKDLIHRQAVACSKMRAQGQVFNASLCSEGYNGSIIVAENDKQKWVVQLRQQVKTLESMSSEVGKEAKDKAVMELKAAEEKNAQYKQYMSKGETALSNSEFDNAINSFNNARSYAANDAESQTTAEAVVRSQKAKTDAARKVRIEKQKEVDKKENEVYGTSTAAVTGLMALLTDRYGYKSSYFRLQAGLGIENLPMISNIDKLKRSETTTSLHPTFHLGFKFGFLNNKGVSIHFNPILQYGINALMEGHSGIHLTYGGLATVYLSPKSDSKLKVFAEGGSLKRVGDYTYDYDAAAGGNSATDRVEKSEYNYNVLRYGGGLMLHFINKRQAKETYIKPGVFFDKMNFAQIGDKPSILFNLQVNISSAIIIDASYSSNYAIGGKTFYPNNFLKGNQNYWSFKIIKQGAF